MAEKSSPSLLDKAPVSILLDSPSDLNLFRAEARFLLKQGVPPDTVQWHVAGSREGDLFEPAVVAEADLFPAGIAPQQPQPQPPLSVTDLWGDVVPTTPQTPAKARVKTPATASEPNSATLAGPKVPAFFLDLCRRVVLHRDPGRFALMYRLLWRFSHEPHLRHDPLDEDRMSAETMARVVRRDMHKMTAFVRFRTVHPASEVAPPPQSPDGAASTDRPVAELLHLAWFEPDHHIVVAIAPFFVRRFTGMHWAILTPDACIEWIPAALPGDGAAGQAAALEAGPHGASPLQDITPGVARRRGRLLLGPGASRQSAPPPDAGEALWLTYYASIFNPARLKLQMMQKEMPRRYWHNLPEARLISTLTAAAHQRSQQMIDKAPTVQPARRLPSAPPRSTAPPKTPSPSESASASIFASTSAREPAIRPVYSLIELKAAMDLCRDCGIGEHATQSVPGIGPANARLMVVGEQPGDQEDLRGTPFVGPAGRLFDRALAELGWPHEALYVTNAVKHFKFELKGQRRIHKTPVQQEVSACLQWLEREVRLVQPTAILALGATAARAVLGRPVAVMKERGQWHRGESGIPVLVTLHPSALLRADPVHAAENFSQWLNDLAHASPVVVGNETPPV